jgi:hypothetical protein
MNNGEARKLVLMAKSERMLAEATTIDEIMDFLDKAELSWPEFKPTIHSNDYYPNHLMRPHRSKSVTLAVLSVLAEP